MRLACQDLTGRRGAGLRQAQQRGSREWDGMDSWERLGKPKTRMKIRLDADMVKSFRKLGPNCSCRINSVLRTYWVALMDGCIQA